MILPIILAQTLASGALAAPVTVSLLNPEQSLKLQLQTYIANFVNTVDENWAKSEGFVAGCAKVYFTVTPEGGINHFEIRESSGSADFDDRAVQAIYRGSPYLPPPLRDEKVLKMLATFCTGEASPTRLPRQLSFPMRADESKESMQIKTFAPNLPQLYLSTEAAPMECKLALKSWFAFQPNQRYGVDFIPSIAPKKTEGHP